MILNVTPAEIIAENDDNVRTTICVRR